jgi:hypothetical protein
VLEDDIVSREQGRAEITKPLAPSYLNYQTPTLINSGSPNSNLPTTNSPTKNLEILEIKLNLKPFETLVATPSAVLLFEVEEPLPSTTLPPEASATTEELLQNAGTLKEDAPYQPVGPNLENVLDAPKE